MDPTSWTLIYVLVNPTSLTPSKSAYAVRRMAVGVVVYFRKEGKALGEITKYRTLFS